MRQGDRAPSDSATTVKPVQSIAVRLLDMALPTTIARPDIAFCLPVAVQLVHADFARLLIAILHVSALLIVLFLLPAQVAVIVMLAGCCSLRYALIQQSLLSDYRSLICDKAGQWYIVAVDRNHQWIAMEQLVMLGPILFIRLRHFGSAVFWITWQSQQDASQWGRLRVLSRLL